MKGRIGFVAHGEATCDETLVLTSNDDMKSKGCDNRLQKFEGQDKSKQNQEVGHCYCWARALSVAVRRLDRKVTEGTRGADFSVFNSLTSSESDCLISSLRLFQSKGI